MSTDVTLFIIFFFVLPFFFLPAGLLIYRYLRQLFALVEQLEKVQPELWQKLGSPKAGKMRSTGAYYPSGTQYFISPFMPLFHWLMAGNFRGLDRDVKSQAEKVRQLFFYSLAAFLLVFLIVVATIVWAETT